VIPTVYALFERRSLTASSAAKEPTKPSHPANLHRPSAGFREERE
jgi:hypothetical protein